MRCLSDDWTEVTELMAIKDFTMRSIIEPVWQELSSLWSGSEFAFYDPSQAQAELEREISSSDRYGAAPDNMHAEVPVGRFEHCW